MRRLILFFVFALCSLSSFGQGLSTDFPSAGANASGWNIFWREVKAADNVWSRAFTGSAAGDVAVTDSGLLRVGLSTEAPSVAVKVGRVIPWSSVASAAARYLPYAGAAAIAYDVWTALRCKGENGRISCDPGGDTSNVSKDTYCFYDYVTPTHCNTVEQTAAQVVATYTANDSSHSGYVLTAIDGPTYENSGANECHVIHATWLYNGSDAKFNACGTKTKVTVAGCSDGSSPSTWDMKCSTGNFVYLSEDEAASLFEKHAAEVSPTVKVELAPKIVEEAEKVGVGAKTQEKVEISGPAQQVGKPATVTEEKADGTKVTKTTTPTYTYNYTSTGVTYKTTNSTVTNSCVGANACSTTKTEEDEESGNVGDTDLPSVKKSYYTRVYAGGFPEVWSKFSLQFQQTPIMSFLNGLVPGWGSGGCPTWSLYLGQYGTHDVSVPCWVWSAIRAIIVVTAVFTARALVFGG